MPTGIGGVTADLPQEEHPRDGTCWNSSRRGGDCARCVDHYRFAPRLFHNRRLAWPGVAWRGEVVLAVWGPAMSSGVAALAG